MTMSDFAMTIDGAACAAGDDFGVLNPATEEELARAPSCSSTQLDDAVAAAKRACASWGRDEALRRDALRKAAELVQASANDIARTLTLEQGKPLAHATGEVFASAAQMKSAADMPIPHEVTRDDAKG